MGESIEPVLVPIKRAATMLGFCRATLYRMEKDKQLVMRRPRGRTMVPMSEIKRIADGEPMQTVVGEPVGEPPKARPKKRQLSEVLS